MPGFESRFVIEMPGAADRGQQPAAKGRTRAAASRQEQPAARAAERRQQPAARASRTRAAQLWAAAGPQGTATSRQGQQPAARAAASRQGQQNEGSSQPPGAAERGQQSAARGSRTRGSSRAAREQPKRGAATELLRGSRTKDSSSRVLYGTRL